MIYLIACQKTNTCKIGYSKSPENRLIQLQTGNPFPLEIIAVKEGNIEDEKLLHETFSHIKHQGEWFEYTDEIRNYFLIDDLVTLESSEYIVIDSKALLYIQKHLDKVDLARVLEMCNMVDGSCYNVLINRKTKELHSKSSLMTELEYSRNKFAILMKKLYDKSIISYMKSVKDGKEQLVILLNPFLARKSKTFHKECLLLFEDLSKK